MAKNLQRKKPGYTKSGVAKIVSMNTKELVSALDKASKKKDKAKIARRLQRLGYVAPVVTTEETVAE
jgi:SOS response regulatory protein OraA/RecX